MGKMRFVHLFVFPSKKLYDHNIEIILNLQQGYNQTIVYGKYCKLRMHVIDLT